MTDIGHEWTDDRIDELEVRMREMYSQAANEMQDRLDAWMKDYERQRAAWEKAVKAGVKTRAEYDDWLSDRSKERTWQTGMIRELSIDAVNADVRARQMINEELPSIIAENANMMGYQIDRMTGLDTMFTLYDQDAVRFLLTDPNLYPTVDVPKDLAWNEQKFAGAISQSILQGESIPDAAKRLQGVFDMDTRAAVMAARTSITYAESSGKGLSFRRAKGLGIPIRQEWRANLDGRTRLAHREADGQVVDVDEKFDVDGHKMSGPGDPTAPGYLVYSCRCRLQPVLDYDNIPEAVVNRYSRLPEGVSYEDWKSGRFRTDAGNVETESSKRERYNDVMRNFSTNMLGAKPMRPRRGDFQDRDEYLNARDEYKRRRDEFQDERTKLINEMVGEASKGYDTAENMRRWAEEHGAFVDIDSLIGNVDVKVIDKALATIGPLMEKYPIVNEYYAKVGTRFDVTLSDTPYAFMDATHGLRFSPRECDTYEHALSTVVDGYTTRTHNDFLGRDLNMTVRGDGTFRTAVTHEFGHNLDNALREKTYGPSENVDNLVRYDREIKELTLAHTTSEYAMTNTSEAFAEGFAEYECNPTSDYARAFGEFLERWL